MKGLVVVLVVLVVIAGVVTVTRNSEESSSVAKEAPSAVEKVVATVAGTNFVYADYSEESLADAEQSGEPYAIFWASKSCATCEGKDKAIKADPESLPEGTTVLRAEFSEADEAMLEKYGVVKYDTFTVFNGDDFETTRGMSLEDLKTALSS